MKKVAIITSLKQAYDIKNLVEAFIVPIKNYSINFPNAFDLEEISKIKSIGKEVFLVMNKSIYNNELDDLMATLKQIDILNINGIIFYDIAI